MEYLFIMPQSAARTCLARFTRLIATDNSLQTVRNARRRLEKKCISESDVLNNISLTPARMDLCVQVGSGCLKLIFNVILTLIINGTAFVYRQDKKI